jgi:alanyl-tRNA synthetase
VGLSPRHHTFFEMLGNFSFGDYFKEEAIVFAWDFLTKTLNLPKERLACTYFAGEQGIAADETAREVWRKVTGFSEDRLRGLGMSDNFWQMGETGPCGPSSEIYFYSGPEVDPDALGQEQSAEGIGWMEIWNLVFTQFDRTIDHDGKANLAPLPSPCIDTGLGLERLATVLQGKTSSYDMDLLLDLVELVAELSGKRYGRSAAPDDVSMRVIADHARSTAFLLAEGILPDRTGRQYVLRRVMRRAIRHGHRLGIVEPFLHRVAERVVSLMSGQYPELSERRDLITSVASAEEVRFRQTIERGLYLLEERFSELEQRQQRVLDGADAFQLYDTYGFPLDLTEVICSERGFEVDRVGYDQALEEARKRSEFKGVERAVESVYREALEKVPPSGVSFVGYERDSTQSSVLAIIHKGSLVNRAVEGESVELVTQATPFYAEQGGQIGDMGKIESEAAGVTVEDTQKPLAGLVTHRGRVERGAINLGDAVRLEVDTARREKIRKNHSATHLLHWALGKVLGPHAQQKGSLVGPDRLRFDFTHTSSLNADQIRQIEDLVNEQILANTPVQTEVLSMQEARQRGAVMIFEEKYGDVVRLLRIGPSRELCGGTHARATGDIGLFKIVSQQGIAAGVRRIVATTGEGSLSYLRDVEQTLERAAGLAKTTPDALAEKVQKLLSEQRSLEKKVGELERQLGADHRQSYDSLLRSAREVGGVKVLGVRTEVSDRGALRELAERLRDQLGSAAIVLVGSEQAGKAQLVLTVSKTLSQRFQASEIIRPIAQMVGGSGGGRPDMALAGGNDAGRLSEAIESVYEQVRAAAQLPPVS